MALAQLSKPLAFLKYAVNSGRRLLSNFAAIGSGWENKLTSGRPIAVFFCHAPSLLIFAEGETPKYAITTQIKQPDISPNSM